MHRATLLHLRVPFSFFLLPVFLFACAVCRASPVSESVIVAFIAWHLFIYPASNGYNSYFDKDQGAIGGLEKPPPVSRELYNASLLLDVAGIAVGTYAGWQFALALFIYGLISKAYSHPLVRLKKYPLLSLLTVGIFQGFFVFMSSIQALTGKLWSELVAEAYWCIPAALSSLMLIGSYPMTQIYQHEEDARRGDQTFSLLLGIRGTFLYTLFVFSIATVGLVVYFWYYFAHTWAWAFLLALSPVLLFFLWWMKQAFANPHLANFRNTMRLNLLSATCLNTFYLLLWFTML
ncbi:MAG: UbiA family prenyltransferase [Cytophagales bacterium]|nr:UbiA family prenyltransferase [Bernardetiaceae bacterium]MDW8204316.1 UbiA family prenyltransferase [Cytophagales bacterium]